MKVHEKQTNNEVNELVDEAMSKYHGNLYAAEVTVDVLMVHDYDDESGEETPCLKANGYDAAAVIKVVSPAQRALGNADALLTICSIWWHGASRAQRIALIDHELTHLRLVERDGEVQRDDLKRPKLKIRLHDYQLGGFRDVIARHRQHAPEVAQVKACRGDGGQYYWDFEEVKEPTVTISALGRSVTLTPKHKERLREAAEKAAE